VCTGTGTALDEAADDFGRVRSRLFAIAYRMLGTVADAEDLVQDVWVEWQSCPERDAVRDPTAFPRHDGDASRPQRHANSAGPTGDLHRATASPRSSRSMRSARASC
jgi:hypothetical protein